MEGLQILLGKVITIGWFVASTAINLNLSCFLPRRRLAPFLVFLPPFERVLSLFPVVYFSLITANVLLYDVVYRYFFGI